jgi:hypothetical protein
LHPTDLRLGWRRDGTPVGATEYAAIDGVYFTVRVDRFFRFRGELRGIVGFVTERAHAFSGLYVVGAEMLSGEHDFTARLCHRYDLVLGPRAPAEQEWPNILGSGVIEGHGIVAVSRECIDAFLAPLR